MRLPRLSVFIFAIIGLLKFVALLDTLAQRKLFNFHFNDAPYPWQIAFQDPASPGFVGISDLHDNIFFYLVLILFGVMWVLSAILFVFKSSSNSLVYKYLSHGTLKCLHEYLAFASNRKKLKTKITDLSLRAQPASWRLYSFGGLNIKRKYSTKRDKACIQVIKSCGNPLSPVLPIST